MNYLLNNSKKVRLVYKGKIDNWKYLDQLQEYTSKSNDVYKNNYNIKNLKLEKHLALDCLVDKDDKIFALSGVFNGGTYPDGVYRVLNRLWARDDMRTGQWSPFLTQMFLLDHLKEFNGILDVAFISIQGLKGKRFLNNYWLNKQAPEWGTGWKMYPKIVKVAPSNKKSGYQYIVYNKKNENSISWPDAGITEEEYNNLPE
jgi:hypothetical protein